MQLESNGYLAGFLRFAITVIFSVMIALGVSYYVVEGLNSRIEAVERQSDELSNNVADEIASIPLNSINEELQDLRADFRDLEARLEEAEERIPETSPLPGGVDEGADALPGSDTPIEPLETTPGQAETQESGELTASETEQPASPPAPNTSLVPSGQIPIPTPRPAL